MTPVLAAAIGLAAGVAVTRKSHREPISPGWAKHPAPPCATGRGAG